MITDLMLYPAMKDSGLPWLGEVPEHWEVRRTRNAIDMRVSNIDKHTKEGELPVRLCNYVDVYKHDRITEHMSFMRATATAEEIERFRLEPGDVPITKDSEAWNDIGIPALVEYTAEDLVCGYHLALLRPRKALLSGAYLLRALQSPAVTYQFHVAANGVTRYGLSHDAIKSVLLPIPPTVEQAAIVRYLNYMDRRIQKYVRAKQKLIKLLEEQKQAIIHRAVTRGLDPNVRLKPSGVEWLGDVPGHWQLLPLKRVCSLLRDGTHLPPPRQMDGFPLLSVRNIVDNYFVRRPDDSRISEHHFTDLCRSFTPRLNDVLLAIVGATLGKVAIVPEMEPFQIQRSLAVLRPHERLLDFRFLAAFLRGPGFQRALWTTVAFSAQPGIYLNTLGNFCVAVPSISEQVSIVEELDDQTARVRGAIDCAHLGISLLREYRTRLIADVVTGKLDVREAAGRLHDEAEEPELVDEGDAISAVDEETVDDLDTVPEEVEA